MRKKFACDRLAQHLFIRFSPEYLSSMSAVLTPTGGVGMVAAIHSLTLTKLAEPHTPNRLESDPKYGVTPVAPASHT